MKRLFSGNKSPKKESSFAPPKALTSSFNSSPSSTFSSSSAQDDNGVSPELSPIVTLLSAQSHRRYNEGVFMLLNDLTSDGKPGDRKWEELYGVLTGTQLAVWDANKLSQYKDDPEKLISTSSKPTYINFTDSSFKAVDTLPSSNGDLNNVIIVSTTLKNRFLLQYSSKSDFNKWYAAFRLATFEYTCLQEAYTGALLSARGSRLSDIRVILSESKYDHEDWVSVRFGSGMPWKRCFAVIEPSPKKSKKKFYPGKIVFYENEKKSKKTAMASIVSATACYTVYPQTPQLIDHSTLIKLEGTISFHKNDSKEASVFLMPEQHFSVPGFDTVIRFLIPTLDAFGLYGRPKKLIADKADPKSLLFGLPVLPHVHYLELEDIIPIASQPSASAMTVEDWFGSIKLLLLRKLSTGYAGCGSVNGLEGAMSSLSLTSSGQSSSAEDFLKPPNRQLSPLTPSFLPTPDINGSRGKFSDMASSRSSPVSSPDERSIKSVRNSGRLSEIYNKYSQIEAPSNTYHGVQDGSLSSLSLGGKAKLSDDELPSHKPAPSNIFDPSFGDRDFNDDLSAPGSTDSLSASREDLSGPPGITVSSPATTPFEQPASVGDNNEKQRVLSPYSEFHQQVTQTIGVPRQHQLSKALVYPENGNADKVLPTPPGSSQLQQPYTGNNAQLENPPLQLPKVRQQPMQPFQQRAPSDNIVPQQLKPPQPLQQQPMRNLTPNGSYQQPYGRQPSPMGAAFQNNRPSPVTSPALESFGVPNNPYAQNRQPPPQQQQQQQQYRPQPQGPRQQQQQQQYMQRPPQQQQQYPPPQQQQQQQQQYPPQQQGYPRQQQYPPQQRPPQQQYPSQGRPNYGGNYPPPPQQQYPPQQQQLPYQQGPPQGMPQQQRARKAPPMQMPPSQQNGNPYASNNQYF